MRLTVDADALRGFMSSSVFLLPPGLYCAKWVLVVVGDNLSVFSTTARSAISTVWEGYELVGDMFIAPPLVAAKLREYGFDKWGEPNPQEREGGED